MAQASIKDVSNRFAIAFVSATPSFDLEISPLDEEGNASSVTSVIYTPNINAQIGGEITWQGITIGYTTATPNEPGEDDRLGRTEYSDYRFQFHLGSKSEHLFRTYYTNFEGFYIDNSRDIDSSLAENEVLQREDFTQEALGFSWAYHLSPEKYSNLAAFAFGAIQTSSGGSWILQLAADQVNYSADSPFIPTQLRPLFGTEQNLNQAKFRSLTAGGGYAYNWIFHEPFFTAIRIIVGLGPQFREYSDALLIEQEEVDLVVRNTLDFSFGYNAEHLFVGAAAGVRWTQYETELTSFETELADFKFTLGYRF